MVVIAPLVMVLVLAVDVVQTVSATRHLPVPVVLRRRVLAMRREGEVGGDGGQAGESRGDRAVRWVGWAVVALIIKTEGMISVVR